MNKLTLNLSPQAMDYIYNCLAKQPWGEVNPLICDIQAQLVEQQKPKEPSNASIARSSESTV